MNKKFLLSLLLILSISFSANANDKSDYHKWRTALKKDSTEAYILKKMQFVCQTKDQYVSLYNHIIDYKNGDYTKELVQSHEGCQTLRGWGVARIIKTYKGSNVVKIEFILPEILDMNDEEILVQKHILRDELITAKEHFSRFIK